MQTIFNLCQSHALYSGGIMTQRCLVICAGMTFLAALPIVAGNTPRTSDSRNESLRSVSNHLQTYETNVDTAAQGFTSANPFAAASTLLYQAPPFDKIHDADYQPALEEGMKQQIAEIEKIASDPSPAAFENTIVAMERTGALLTRVAKVFFALTQSNTNDDLQKIQQEEAPRLAAHSDAIFMNEQLFKRVKGIYDQRNAVHLTDAQKYLVERYYRDFVHAGALLSEADKKRLRELNQEESKLTTSFQNQLLAATKAGALVIDDNNDLDGLSEAEISAAAEAAHQRGLDGKWVLTLQNTTLQPAQVTLRKRAVRERLFNAATMRAEHGDSNDTRQIILRLASLRIEKAKLLGFPTYAAYVLSDRMAKTPDAAIKLLTDLAPAAVAKAESEAAKMQALVDHEHGGFKLEAWDWQYYAEQVRKAEYALDDAQIKPYFEMNRVLEDGVFYAANQLYGLSFKERKDIPVYNPDVRVFEVLDKDGKSIGLWYCDYFKRDNKSGGAWEDTFVDGTGLLNTKPVVFNVLNIPKPGAGQPALLDFDMVTTMFHEFGHALHALLTNVEYPRLAGTNVPTDFVEFPSQINEHWALYPAVFAHYAKHYKTGEPMPKELVEKIKKTKTFNQGFATMEYLEAALLDFAWHTLAEGSKPGDADAFELNALKHFNVYMPLVPPRYHSTYFAHIWSSGYAAGYYAYMWSEVLDDDAYAWFTENGGLTRANGQRFRDMILSRGGTEDAGAMYRAFRGRDPDVKALIEERGLNEK